MRRQIAGLTQAGAQCVEMVYEELRRLTTLCDCPQLQQYQDLTARVVDTVRRIGVFSRENMSHLHTHTLSLSLSLKHE